MRDQFRATLWAYPWDLFDLGAEQFLTDITERAGATGVSLAASYHAGRFLQARSPRRKVLFPADGTIYFRPSLESFHKGRIQPEVAALVEEQGDPMALLLAARERYGFQLSAWTVCLHNTRIGTAYPDVTVQNAFGDREYFSLCPSHPDARAYVRTLVGDMTRRYPVDAVELETPHFLGFAHRFHHEKEDVGLSEREQFLLSLCFCEHCQAGARRAGVDAEAARREVEAVVAEACNRPVPMPSPDFLAEGPDGLADLPYVLEYVRWRTQPVTSLLAEVREAAAPGARVVCMTPVPERCWTVGLDFAAAARRLDGLLVITYGMDAEQVAEALAAAREEAGPHRSLSAGLKLSWPEVAGPEALAARVQAARQGGADGAHFYNHGLVPASRLDWVRAALK